MSETAVNPHPGRFWRALDGFDEGNQDGIKTEHKHNYYAKKMKS